MNSSKLYVKYVDSARVRSKYFLPTYNFLFSFSGFRRRVGELDPSSDIQFAKNRGNFLLQHGTHSSPVVSDVASSRRTFCPRGLLSQRRSRHFCPELVAAAVRKVYRKTRVRPLQFPKQVSEAVQNNHEKQPVPGHQGHSGQMHRANRRKPSGQHQVRVEKYIRRVSSGGFRPGRCHCRHVVSNDTARDQ